MVLAGLSGCDSCVPGDEPICGTDTDMGACEPDPEIAGEWTTEPVDWSDPGLPGDDPKTELPAIMPHHPYLTTVHASHLPTEELILFHGQSEERVWPIGAPASEIRWHPIPYEVTPALCSYDSGENPCYADVFCSGHMLLPDGRFLVAGGNVTGGPNGGGLVNTFTYDPWGSGPAVEALFPYGWSEHSNMAIDRWYPTLTALPDGRVLISSGASRVEGGNNKLEIFDPSDGTVDLLVGADYPETSNGGMPVYPFMFVLPNGDIFYAGAEGALAVHSDGRVLLADYDGTDDEWEWHEREFESDINGGSAVMYEPGKIMKSGGLVFGDVDQFAIDDTEVIDLSRVDDCGGYDEAPDFNTIVAEPMKQARHYHTLTLLPDGRVLATGGNYRGTSTTGDSFQNYCDFDDQPIAEQQCDPDETACPAVPSRCFDSQCPFLDEAPCSSSLDCGAECQDDGDCPAGSTCGANDRCEMACNGGASTCGAVGHCTPSGLLCDPGNNACYATLTAEIWDPSCMTWTELGPQQVPRMYHSTALLLRDGRVISMGGGHRQGLEEQPSAEFFEPQYAEDPAAEKPNFTFGNGGLVEPGQGAPARGDAPHLNWGGSLQVTVQSSFPNGDPVPVSHATLVRLGSVTHQFDMDQRFIRLDVTPPTGSGSTYTVEAFTLTSEEAPPGFYMLFLISNEGEPSIGRYVVVDDQQSSSYVCEASASFDATETSCAAEPLSSECDSGDVKVTPLDPPVIAGSVGPISGFRVLVAAGMVRDHESPTVDELAAIEALCVRACEAHYTGRPGQAANCDEPGAFETPIQDAESAQMSLELLRDALRHGEELFLSDPPDCDLGSDCYPAFDEALAAAVPARVTPADDALTMGEEWSLSIEATLSADSSFAVGPVSATMAGTVGYSECAAGNTTGSCSFYVGSLELELTEPLELALECNNIPEIYELDELHVRLAQPAFGVAGALSSWKAFPPSELSFDIKGVVNELPFSSRRPNLEPVYVAGTAGSLELEGDVNGAWVELELPCGNTSAEVILWLDFEVVDTLGSPPQVEIDVPSPLASCPDEVALDAALRDDEDDIESLRWLVDGVLLHEDVDSLDFTTGHELTAIARDARGATTTATTMVTCRGE